MADAPNLPKTPPKPMFVLQHTLQKSPDEFEATYAAHKAFIKGNMESGRFLAAGPTNPWTGGVILARGENREELEELVAGDPLVGEGITKYEVLEFKPVNRNPALDAFLGA